MSNPHRASRPAIKISRRGFLVAAGGLAGTAMLRAMLPRRALAGTNADVATIGHPQMVVNNKPDLVLVQSGLDACINALAGTSAVGQAWQRLLPGITATSKVSVKLNCLFPGVSVSFEMIAAVVGGLKSMFNNTFPAGNILLYDNNYSDVANRIAATYGTTALGSLGVVHLDPSPQYASTSFNVDGRTKYPATFLETANYHIVVSAMKAHQLYGITASIKNMIGACSESKTSFTGAADSFHGEAPHQPYVDLHRFMKNKISLYIVDMLFATTSNWSDYWDTVVKRIAVGRDPCAVDTYVADFYKNQLSFTYGKEGLYALQTSLSRANLGTMSYNLLEPSFPTATKPTRDDLDKLIEQHRQGKATDAAVRQLIQKYRQ